MIQCKSKINKIIRDMPTMSSIKLNEAINDAIDRSLDESEDVEEWKKLAKMLAEKWLRRYGKNK